MVCSYIQGGSYPAAEMQLVYSTAPVNWADSLIELGSFLNSSITLIDRILIGTATPGQAMEI